jgi:uncharacterized protein YecE (DUF72 family)
VSPGAAPVEFLVGTSGFSYPAWRGPFYPEALPPRRMLEHYAGVFRTVEINNTFYRMPAPALLETWAAQTPPGFRFAVKAPQQITHRLRLRDATEPMRELLRRCSALGERLGPILVQLPPNLKVDPPRLESFLSGLPPATVVAIEFRHPSWFHDDTWALLREHRAALCIAQSGDLDTPVVATAPVGYVRLRRDDYGAADLAAWASRLRAVPEWRQVYVFLKHDEAGRAPALARDFLAALA